MDYSAAIALAAPHLYPGRMGETQRKKQRPWLAFLGVIAVFVGAAIGLLGIIAFFGGDSSAVIGGLAFTGAALLLISLGVWIIRRSGVSVGDALNL